MTDEERVPKVGDLVIYCDERSVDHNALVTVAWGHMSSINLVFVAGDDSKTDNYGRQLQRESSVSHAGPHTAHGRYWRLPSEEKVPYKPPTSV